MKDKIDTDIEKKVNKDLLTNSQFQLENNQKEIPNLNQNIFYNQFQSQQKLQLQKFSQGQQNIKEQSKQKKNDKNNLSFLSNHQQNNEGKNLKIQYRQDLQQYYGQSVETQFSTNQINSLDNQTLSKTNNFINQGLSSSSYKLDKNLSQTNNQKISQKKNLKLTNQEEKIKKTQENSNNHLQNQIYDCSKNSFSMLSQENDKDIFNEKYSYQTQKSNVLNYKQLSILQGLQQDYQFQENQSQILNYKTQRQQNNKKKFKGKQNKKYQKKKFINFIFQDISLDIHFHSAKAYLNGIEADLIFNQNPQDIQSPQYKHQETLYIECKMKLKQNIFGKTTLQCKLFRKNQYINKAIINGNIYYRNEKINFINKMSLLFSDFFKLNFQIKNFQITFSMNNNKILLTQLNKYALKKCILKTDYQYIGEFEQNYYQNGIVLQVNNQYQQMIKDKFQYFVSKYFIYQLFINNQGQVYIQSNIVTGFAKQIQD